MVNLSFTLFLYKSDPLVVCSIIMNRQWAADICQTNSVLFQLVSSAHVALITHNALNDFRVQSHWLALHELRRELRESTALWVVVHACGESEARLTALREELLL